MNATTIDARVIRVTNTADSEPKMSWRKRIASRVRDIKDRVVQARWFPAFVQIGGITVGAVGGAVAGYLLAKGLVMLFLAIGAPPVVAAILAIWIVFVIINMVGAMLVANL